MDQGYYGNSMKLSLESFPMFLRRSDNIYSILIAWLPPRNILAILEKKVLRFMQFALYTAK